MSDADAALSITFDLTADDLVAATEFAGTRAAADRRWMGRAMMFAGSMAATGACLAGAGALTLGTAGLSGGLTAAFVAAYTGFLWPDPAAAVRRAVATQVAGNVRRTVTVDAAGVRVANAWGETTTRWPGVARAAVTDRHLLLFNRLGTAVVVPRRAFATAADFAAFAAVAQAGVPPGDAGRPTGGFPVLPVPPR